MMQWNVPVTWDWLGFNEVCEVNPRKPKITNRPDHTPTSFVPMEDVDEVEGRFRQIQVRPFAEVKRGYTYFEENDVLFAKITPSMENGKTAIARELIDDIGFGTTEFHVLRPNKTIIPEWLHYYIRRKSFRMEAKQHFRGAVGQQRVPREFLETYSIPLPYPNELQRSIAEQQRIVSVIQTLLAEIRDMQEINNAILADANKLFDSASRDVFRDISGQYPKRNLISMTTKIGSGSTPRGGKSNYRDTGIPFIRSQNVQWNSFTTDGLVFVDKNIHANMASTEVVPEDVLLNITGASIGRACQVPEEFTPANVNQHVSIIRSDGTLLPEYIMFWLTNPSTQDYIDDIQSGATRQALTKSQIESFEIPVPDESMQRRIVNRLRAVQEEVDEILALNHSDEENIQLLEQSILAQAFRGEL